MPRTKETRNHSGSILKKNETRENRKITYYVARKRYFDPKTGKYKDKTQRCATHSEAKTALVNLQNDVEKLLTEETELIKDARLFELIAYFEKEYVKPHQFVAGRHIGYRKNLDTLKRILREIEKYFGNLPVRKINYEQIRAFSEKLATTKTKRGGNPAAGTVNEKLSLFRRVLTVGVQLQWIEINPFKLGEALITKKGQKARTRILSFEEENRLLAECVNDIRVKTIKWRGKKDGVEMPVHVHRAYLKPYILLSLDTAMRRGEVFDMKWRQVDFDNHAIYLTEEAASNSKTGAEGVLPMTTRIHDLLTEIKRVSPHTGKDDFVLGKVDFKKAFNGACADAKIFDLQYRDLRATGATRMLMAGTNDVMTRKVTRHARAETLLDHYTRINLVNAQNIGARLDSLIQSNQPKGKSKGAPKVKQKSKASKKAA